MNINPKVSVITPAYNAEKYISESVDSILNQTFNDFEIIVIDDCSTDKTWDIIQEYAVRDNRIVAVKNDENLGIAGNRNKGLGLARGKYIAWQDADDISLPTRIQKQFDFLESHPEVGIVGGFLQFFSDDGRSSGIRKYCENDADLRKKIFRYSPVAQPASMIRKQCLDEAGKYNLKYPPAEDIDMSFRIGMKYKFANLQEIVLKYREHPNSATFTRLKKIELSTMEIRKKYSRGFNYRPTLLDVIYNMLQFVSIFIVPPRVKIWLFDKIRNN